MSMLRGARLAVTTLTVFPLPAPRRELDRKDAAWAMSLSPVVGLGLGGVLAILAFLLGKLEVAPLPTAAAVVVAMALLTRGMHLDGLADTVDGLGSYRDRDGALAIMKSPEVGPMGVAAIVAVMLIDTAALAVLVGGRHWAAVVGGIAAGRAAMSLCCWARIPAARPGGLGALVAGTVRFPIAVLGFAVCALAAGAYRHPVDVIWPFVGSVVVTAGLLWQAMRRLGGITGDVLGAACEIATAVTLLGLSAR